MGLERKSSFSSSTYYLYNGHGNTEGAPCCCHPYAQSSCQRCLLLPLPAAAPVCCCSCFGLGWAGPAYVKNTKQLHMCPTAAAASHRITRVNTWLISPQNDSSIAPKGDACQVECAGVRAVAQCLLALTHARMLFPVCNYAWCVFDYTVSLRPAYVAAHIQEKAQG